MRDPRRVPLLASFTIAPLIVAAVIAACSEDDPTPPANVDGGDAGIIVDPTDGATGAADADASDGGGGAAVDGAGHVTCGASDCDRNLGNYCCVTAQGATCAPDRVNACVGGGDRLCDERSDCQGEAYCCAELDASVVRSDCFYGARCAGAGAKWEVCKPGAPEQCESGKTCKLVTCPGQGTLYLCDVPPGCQ